MKKNGFTIIEIMIVVAIMGILAAIAIPSFMKARNKARANNPTLAENPSVPAEPSVSHPIACGDFVATEKKCGNYTVITVEDRWNSWVILSTSNWAVRLR